MRASDIMTTSVITVDPDTPVRKIAATLLAYRISGVPVVDSDGRVVGIVSEGDLMHRAELGTERRRSWWLALFGGPEDGAADFVRAHGLRAADVMTTNVVSVDEETSVQEIARILEEGRIKRVPVLRDGRLVGIVSRADLLRGLVAAPVPPAVAADDATIRNAVVDRLDAEDWAAGVNVNVIVTGGIVHLWGYVQSEPMRDAVRILVEGVPGVRGIEDHLGLAPPAYAGGP